MAKQPSSDLTIRAEQPGDRRAVFDVNERAFDGLDEARLVDALRARAGGPDAPLSLVAVVGGRVVGHVLFTPVTVADPSGPRHAIALGPMAVLPEYQRRGIGSRLVVAGLEACDARGEHVVFVLGHERFYPRFGFAPAGARGLYFRDRSNDPHFMVAELRAGALGDITGEVRYLSEFDAF